MRKYGKVRINTFFVEIIIIILFFSIAATIIVQVFAQTNHDVKINDIKAKAVENATSISGLYNDNCDVVECIKTVFGENIEIKTNDKGKYIVFLDEDFTNIDEYKPIVFYVNESESKKIAGTLKKINIKYSYCDEVLLETEASSYINNEL